MGGVIFDVTIRVTIYVIRHFCRETRDATRETRHENTPHQRGSVPHTPSQGGDHHMQISCQIDFTKLSKQYIVAQRQRDHKILWFQVFV